MNDPGLSPWRRLATASRTAALFGAALLSALALAQPAATPTGAGATSASTWSVPAAGEVIDVPAIRRELRGAWVASVANIDWPSTKTLTIEEQQAEAIAMLDRAASIGLNAIMLQVRPSCDALYKSELEPWSEFLTGESGTGPARDFDPLAFWVEQAHARGLELHAWFNPFRARHFEAKGPEAPMHISKARPDLVRSYDNYLWLDPGEPDARAHSLAVMLDVARRYDIDAVHLDDYFYPYPKTVNGVELPFPDDVPFKRYVDSGGTLARGDWRRDNINTFMRELYNGVRAIKPQLRVGISPFGIWRPGYPSMVKGFDAYEKLAADATKWMREGWLDECVPQLYWKVEAPHQPFGPLLAWWRGENSRGRHVYAGLNASNVGKTAKAWTPDEITRQIAITRNTADAANPAGVVLFSMKALAQPELNSALTQTFHDVAIAPAREWLAPALAVETPTIIVRAAVESGSHAGPTIEWSLRDAAELRWIVVSKRKGGGTSWSTHVFPATQRFAAIDAASDAVAVRAIDRAGRESEAAINLRR